MRRPKQTKSFHHSEVVHFNHSEPIINKTDDNTDAKCLRSASEHSLSTPAVRTLVRLLERNHHSHKKDIRKSKKY